MGVRPWCAKTPGAGVGVNGGATHVDRLTRCG